MLDDILSGEDPQVLASIAIVAQMRPDILLLTDFDYDYDSVALRAFAAELARAGLDLPYFFAPRPNSGVTTGLDMDGNGRTAEPRDAQGYGRFTGDGGMALLSRWPIDKGGAQDFAGLLWRDLPGAVLPVSDGAPFPSQAARAVQRLSTSGHWAVSIDAAGGPLTILAFAATPPVFDGPEDLNGLRNRDELRLWQLYLDRALGPILPGPFLVMGNANLDPEDGDGLRAAMADFLADPRLQDPRPSSPGGRAAADPDQSGDPALDTADWPDGAPGNLRVDYVLPSAALAVTGAGVFWPAPEDPLAGLLGSDGLAAGPHRLVWVDILR